MNKKGSVDAPKPQKLLVNIMIFLFALTLIGTLYAAGRCYLPYNFTNALSASQQKLIWSFLVLPCITVPFALWLSNILAKRLGTLTVVTAFAVCGFFAFAPLIYKVTDSANASYIVSSIGFFLISTSASILITDLFGSKRRCPKVCAVILCSLGAAVQGLVIGLFINYIIRIGSFIRTALCFIMPPLCLICFLCVLVNLFCNIFSLRTFILWLLTEGIGTMCCAFSLMNADIMFIIFAVLGTLSFLNSAFDVFRAVFTKDGKHAKHFRDNKEIS